ncbi:MAG: RNA polymerase sigma factor [Bacillales bacterium]|jgi:RNA polymerase sigma-70 factor (ECF subfamily)|nr:RNA polymerase sigma factor [Bacillales bacterium]
MVEIDKTTLQRFKNGDELAFNKIYDAYYKLIKQICFSYVKDNGIADDLVQNTFVLLWNNKDKINCDNRNFKYYVTQIAKNTCINYGVKNNKFKVVYLKNEDLDYLEYQETVEDQDNYLSQIRELIDQDSYDIIILHYIHGLKLKEIAIIKGTTTSTITSKASRAMRLLQEKLKNE